VSEEALRRALAAARSGEIVVLPSDTRIEPSMESLAQAIEAMTAHELLAGMSGEAKQVCRARDRIAAAVRSKRCVPLLDDQGNIVGWRFGEG
jgi:hypothetical protein